MPRKKKQYVVYTIDREGVIVRGIATKHGNKKMDVIFDGATKPVTVSMKDIFDEPGKAAAEGRRLLDIDIRETNEGYRKTREDFMAQKKKKVEALRAKKRLLTEQVKELRASAPGKV